MKDWQKEIENVLLDDEEDVLKKLEKTYKQSLQDVKKHAKELQNDLDKLIADDPDNENLIRSKVYQLNYQKALEKQINGYMDVIKRDNVKDINDYLKTVYSDGFMTQQYGLMKQGVSITMPINQKLLVKSITYKTENIPLSTRIYKNVEKAKTNIIAEISRGLSVGMSNQDIARNLENSMGVSSRKAWQLAQNEGARVRKDATIDCIKEAKKKGADLVKMWDATMDSKTRPIHAELHGKWAEVDEKFEYSGGEVFAPKEFGIPALDINCRCALLSVPRWDVDDNARHYDNAWRDNENDEMFVDVRNYQEWQARYMQVMNANNSQLTQQLLASSTKLKGTMNIQDFNNYINLVSTNGNEGLKKCYNDYADSVNAVIRVADDDGGYYTSSNNSVTYSYVNKYIAEGKSKYSTLAHEVGHSFDANIPFNDVHYTEIEKVRSKTGWNTYFKNHVSCCDEFLEAMRKDKVNLEKALNNPFDASTKIDIYNGKASSSGLQDALDGMFGTREKGIFDWGHGEQYYNRTYDICEILKLDKALQDAYKELGYDASNQTKVKEIVRDYETASELWANINSAVICGGKELDYMQKYMPNTMDAFNKIMEDFAKR